MTTPEPGQVQPFATEVRETLGAHTETGWEPESVWNEDHSAINESDHV